MRGATVSSPDCVACTCFTVSITLESVLYMIKSSQSLYSVPEFVLQCLDSTLSVARAWGMCSWSTCYVYCMFGMQVLRMDPYNAISHSNLEDQT